MYIMSLFYYLNHVKSRNIGSNLKSTQSGLMESKGRNRHFFVIFFNEMSSGMKKKIKGYIDFRL